MSVEFFSPFSLDFQQVALFPTCCEGSKCIRLRLVRFKCYYGPYLLQEPHLMEAVVVVSSSEMHFNSIHRLIATTSCPPMFRVNMNLGIGNTFRDVKRHASRSVSSGSPSAHALSIDLSTVCTRRPTSRANSIDLGPSTELRVDQSDRTKHDVNVQGKVLVYTDIDLKTK